MKKPIIFGGCFLLQQASQTPLRSVCWTKTQGFPVLGNILGPQKATPLCIIQQPRAMSSLSNPHSPSPGLTLNQTPRVTTPLSKKVRKQVSFQRQITALSFPTCPPVTPMLACRRKRPKGRLPSTGPDSPRLNASFSLQKFLHSC